MREETVYWFQGKIAVVVVKAFNGANEFSERIDCACKYGNKVVMLSCTLIKWFCGVYSKDERSI